MTSFFRDQSMSYAKLAGLQPIYGLCKLIIILISNFVSLICTLIFIFGDIVFDHLIDSVTRRKPRAFSDIFYLLILLFVSLNIDVCFLVL